ncbi:ABC transporter permease [Prosthecomicrobium sp. N25]|uniref:ABC transporter permease n=1 Tax=Prosthecomicrobium sp. N25 TaxID=3129254 RepID=UPI0030770152
MAKAKQDRGGILATRVRVIHALLQREAARKGSGVMGYLALIAEPLALVVGLSALRYELNPIPPLGPSMPLFFLNGVVVFYVFNKVEAYVSNTMGKNQQLLNFSVIVPMDLYLSQMLYVFVSMFFLYHFILLAHNFIMIAIYPNQVLWPEDILRIYEAIIMAAMYGFVLGILNASIEQFWPVWENIFSWVRRGQYIFSGKMFVVDYAPTTVREVIYWNPLMHPIELARSGFYPYYESKSMDLPYFYGSLLALGVVAFSLERFARQKLTADS